MLGVVRHQVAPQGPDILEKGTIRFDFLNHHSDHSSSFLCCCLEKKERNNGFFRQEGIRQVSFPTLPAPFENQGDFPPISLYDVSSQFTFFPPFLYTVIFRYLKIASF